MKNIKLYAILGLCFGTLFLTACGGGDSKQTLTCSLEEDGQKTKYEVSYDEDGKEPQDYSLVISTEIPEGTSEEEIESAKSLMESMLCSNEEMKCTVKQNGDSLDVTLSGNFKDLLESGSLDIEEENPTIDELKKELEDSGATCKKS